MAQVFDKQKVLEIKKVRSLIQDHIISQPVLNDHLFEMLTKYMCSFLNLREASFGR